MRTYHFKRLHPAVALMYYAGVLALLFTVKHPVFLCAALTGIVSLTCFYAGGRAFLRVCRFAVPMALVIMLLNPLLVRRGATILFYVFGNPVTLESTLYGVYNAGLIAAVVILFTSFNAVLDPPAFLYLFGKYAPRTAFMLHMALRALPRFAARAQTMRELQRMKGEGDAVALLKAFTANSLEEGMETAVVLRTRDYGANRRTSYRRYIFSVKDGFWIVIFASIWISSTFLILRGSGGYIFYPRLGPFTLNYLDLSLFGLFTFGLFLPLLYEGFYYVRHRI
jgi:energy-coupling factor transport system permease protein